MLSMRGWADYFNWTISILTLQSELNVFHDFAFAYILYPINLNIYSIASDITAVDCRAGNRIFLSISFDFLCDNL